MPSCLGLYIEDNLIKYAKVSKNNETVKVEAFGVKFYEKIGTAIKQIIEETYSFKVPISINSSDEWYNKIEVFSLLSKKDMESAIKTEFENICYVKEVNQNIYEQRHIFSNSQKSNDKLQAIHISVPKTSIEQRKNQFLEQNLKDITNISPISISIVNLLKREKKGTEIVVNIEKDTTITKVVNGAIANIQVLKFGAQEILEKINKKENSYAKAYEICKNSTIYTETDKDLQYEENEYLEDIMPTLFKIVTEVRKTVDDTFENIDRIYITGTGSLVNNIDIYFQEYMKDIPCEVLRPSFIANNSKINIKDYIEVNSAIAIGLQGLNKNDRSINFKSESSLLSLLNSNVGDIDIGQLEIAKSIGNFFDNYNRQFNVLAISSVLLLGAFIGGSLLLENQLQTKIDKTEISISDTNTKINDVQEYNKKLNSQISNYKSLIRNIETANDSSLEDKRYKNAIPDFLNKVMVAIPRDIQVISIENTNGAHVKIVVKSKKFQHIAYFKTKLETEEILEEVISDTGRTEVIKEDMGNGIKEEVSYLIVTIEGELP